MIRTLSLALCLATPLLALPTQDCMERGDYRDLTFDRPPIDGDGMPTDARWNGGGTGDPTGFEDDLFFDDIMGSGEAVGDGDQATLKLWNGADYIFGPNLLEVEPQSHCVEVYMKWYFTYTVHLTIRSSSSTTVGGDSSTHGSSRSYDINVVDEVSAPPQTVCPCNE